MKTKVKITKETLQHIFTKYVCCRENPGDFPKDFMWIRKGTNVFSFDFPDTIEVDGEVGENQCEHDFQNFWGERAIQGGSSCAKCGMPKIEVRPKPFLLAPALVYDKKKFCWELTLQLFQQHPEFNHNLEKVIWPAITNKDGYYEVPEEEEK